MPLNAKMTTGCETTDAALRTPAATHNAIKGIRPGSGSIFWSMEIYLLPILRPIAKSADLPPQEV